MPHSPSIFNILGVCAKALTHLHRYIKWLLDVSLQRPNFTTQWLSSDVLHDTSRLEYFRSLKPASPGGHFHALLLKRPWNQRCIIFLTDLRKYLPTAPLKSVRSLRALFFFTIADALWFPFSPSETLHLSPQLPPSNKLFYTCLVLFAIAVIKTTQEKSMGQLIIPCACPSL